MPITPSILVLVATLLVATSAAAQDPADTILRDMSAIATDALLLVTAPARFDAYDWGIAAGSLAAVGMMTTVDEPLRRAMSRGHDATRDWLAVRSNSFGTIGVALLISGGTYLGGLALDAPGVRRAGLHAGQSLLYAGILTTATKFLVGRERPAYEEGAFVFRPLSRDDRYYSLPSGHATVAFALASSLSADIDHPAATIALYGVATMTALGRVYDDRHWGSDVLLGAIIGTACGYGVTHLHDDRRGAFIIVPGVERVSLVVRF